MKAWVAPPSGQGGQPGDGARRSCHSRHRYGHTNRNLFVGLHCLSFDGVPVEKREIYQKKRNQFCVSVARPAVVEDHSFVIIHVSANSGRL